MVPMQVFLVQQAIWRRVRAVESFCPLISFLSPQRAHLDSESWEAPNDPHDPTDKQTIGSFALAGVAFAVTAACHGNRTGLN